jgi:hypothetical protein
MFKFGGNGLGLDCESRAVSLGTVDVGLNGTILNVVRRTAWCCSAAHPSKERRYFQLRCKYKWNSVLGTLLDKFAKAEY